MEFSTRNISSLCFLFSCGSLGELKKPWEHTSFGLWSHSISLSPKLPLMFLLNNLIMSLRFLLHASWQGPRQSQLSPMEIKSELSKLLFTYKSTSHWKLYLVRQTLWKHQETAVILLTSTHCYFTLRGKNSTNLLSKYWEIW